MATGTTTKKRYKPDYTRAAFRSRNVGDESPEGEQRVFCPICEDPNTSQSPSASMNHDSGLWNCLKNAHGGSIYDLVQDLKKNTGFDIRAEYMKGKHADPAYHAAQTDALNAGRANSGPPLPSEDQVSGWAEALLANKTALNAFTEKRGIDKRTIITFEIGWDGSRYTLPVRDAGGQLLNVRRYRMGGAGPDKMLNWTGHGTAQIFHPEIIATSDDIVLTEGETDCILLNQEGIPAVTHTAGAQTFRPAWAPLFAGKNVYVAYDADDAGRKGSKKVESTLRAFAANVYIIDMPETTKGADITDYIHLEGHSKNDFLELMAISRETKGIPRKADLPVATTGEHMSLNASMDVKNQSKTIQLTVSIAGKQQEPYTAPRLITATCDQSKGVVCQSCPLSAKNGQAQVEIRADDEQLFRFVDVPEQRRKILMKEMTGARCTDRVEFEVEENYHIEELLVQPSVDDRKDDETQQPVKRTAFSVSSEQSTVNNKVELIGRNVVDPKTSKLRFMAWANKPVEMDIDRFEMTPELREELKQFQPEPGQSALDKSLEIAADMAENVTHIYGRDLLHVAYDLVWHSVLSFKVYDMLVAKGWLEMAVVGDTRTGKSEVATRLIQHYRSGQLVSCEGMSFPGIVGGVQQIDGRWHMTWGVVPMNDRRLCVLDEVSGLKESGVVEQMSSIRSSGIAQITKIASESTSARTRLIWITNPAGGASLDSFNDAGMGALRTIVPANEDIARFDFVMATKKDDVDTKLINSGFGEQHSPSYSTAASEALIKWVWSLGRDDVVVSAKAAEEAVAAALDLGDRYVSDPPLIQSENVRFKVLRIAAALAARTFSISARGKLLVNAEHVRDAVKFLDMIYEQESMGYARMSRRTVAATARAKEKRINVLNFLKEHPDDVLMTLRMVGGNTFKLRDFEDHGNMDKAEAKAIVHTLLKWQVIKLKSRGDIAMDPVLISVLRELEDEDEVA